MLRSSKLIIFLALLTAFSSSCVINRDFILQTDEDFVYNAPFIDSTNREYKIPINSSISVMVFTRNGDVIFEALTSAANASNSSTSSRGSNFLFRSNNTIEFLMDAQGLVHLPLVGPQRLVGMTVFEAQAFLEKKFSEFFVDPYCIIKVTNRRYMFFNGSGGQGAVIPMETEKVNLIEAIARGGGLNPRANSSRVRVIRNINGKQQVYLFDLSRIDAAKFFDFYIESGDIIYVDPMPRFASELLTVITPALTLLSTIILYLSVVAK
jgi:polysaccharide export outer membrane protein